MTIKLLLVDGNRQSFRAFFALHELIRKDSKIRGCIQGMLFMRVKQIWFEKCNAKKEIYSCLQFAFDAAKHIQNRIFFRIKAGRFKNNRGGFKEQMPYIR